MNIKFSYLYRDASNYKQFNEIVFANPNHISIHTLQNIIRSKLIEGSWFIAKDWNVPDLHFKEYFWDKEFDHEWHEFELVEVTTDAATANLSLEDFINLLQKDK